MMCAPLSLLALIFGLLDPRKELLSNPRFVQTSGRMDDPNCHTPRLLHSQSKMAPGDKWPSPTCPSPNMHDRPTSVDVSPTPMELCPMSARSMDVVSHVYQVHGCVSHTTTTCNAIQLSRSLGFEKQCGLQRSKGIVSIFKLEQNVKCEDYVRHIENNNIKIVEDILSFCRNWLANALTNALTNINFNKTHSLSTDQIMVILMYTYDTRDDLKVNF